MKYYQVIFIDEYENLYELGNYKNLADAEPDINRYLAQYVFDEESGEYSGDVPEFGENKNLDRLTEYPGTYGYCFDRTICVLEGSIRIAGFIKDTNDTLKEIKDLLGEIK